MLENISISNFKGITNLEISNFKKVNLFTGKNNCGKTTVLEAIDFALNPKSSSPCDIAFGRKSFNDNNHEKWLSIFNKMDADKKPQIYAKYKNSTEITLKFLKIVTIDIIGANNLNYGVEFLCSVKKPEDSYNSESRASKALSALTGSINPYTFEVRITDDYSNRPSLPFNLPLLNIYATDKDNKLTAIKTVFLYGSFNPSSLAQKLDKFLADKNTGDIVTVLKKLEPSLTNITLGANNIVRCDLGYNKLLPINVMGDGFLKIFSYILNLSDARNGVVLIDEIENGLHYSSLETLWKAIFQAAKEFNVQVFATTHSLECTKAFLYTAQEEGYNELINYYRLERKDDIFKVVDYEPEILETAFEMNLEVR